MCGDALRIPHPRWISFPPSLCSTFYWSFARRGRRSRKSKNKVIFTNAVCAEYACWTVFKDLQYIRACACNLLSAGTTRPVCHRAVRIHLSLVGMPLLSFTCLLYFRIASWCISVRNWYCEQPRISLLIHNIGKLFCGTRFTRFGIRGRSATRPKRNEIQ